MKRAWALLILTGCSGSQVRERPINASIREGVAFLLKTQNRDGSWATGRHSSGFDVLAAVPGAHDAFRVGATALCVLALLEAGETDAARRGADYLAAYDGVRRANRSELYNVWAHTYGLQALARVHAKTGSEAYL